MSTPCWISARAVALSPLITASARSLRPALRVDTKAITRATLIPMIRVKRIRLSLEVLKPACTVTNAFLMNVEHVEHTQEQITGGHRLAGIRQMTSAFKSAV